jgi:hypothetical protein
MVRTAGFLVDADTDTLVKDVFIWWSERFERDGVDFQVVSLRLAFSWI